MRTASETSASLLKVRTNNINVCTFAEPGHHWSIGRVLMYPIATEEERDDLVRATATC